MAVWAVLWAAALVLRARLDAAGHGWWIWTPPSALALGVFGLWYIHRLRLRQQREEDRPPAHPGPGPGQAG